MINDDVGPLPSATLEYKRKFENDVLIPRRFRRIEVQNQERRKKKSVETLNVGDEVLNYKG